MDVALWALGRGTGVTALVFLSISVALGVETRSGRPLLSLPRFGIAEIHQSAALIGTILVAVHVLTLLADPYAQLRLVDYLAPFLGAHKPLWLGLGTLAFDLLIAVTATGLLRHRLGQRVFRFVHWAAYGLWPLAVIHGLGSGTDVGHVWFIVVTVGCVTLVAAASVWRLRTDFIEYRDARSAERRSAIPLRQDDPR